MIKIRRKAWRALAQFAPEKFPPLLLRYGAAKPGSVEQQTVRYELEKLVFEFKTWAWAFLAQNAKVEMEAAAQRVQIDRALAEKYWAVRLLPLEGADLTLKEKERLMRHWMRLLDRPIRPIEEALKELEHHWKHEQLWRGANE